MKIFRLIDPILRKFENFQWYLKGKYFLWDNLINNQSKLLSSSIRRANQTVRNFIVEPDSLSPEKLLHDLFISNGSDKSKRHNYHQIYGPALQNVKGNILEIGLGSESTNRYASGKPGGALLSLREMNPNLVVFGADIDREAIDQVDFSAFEVDQTNHASLRNLGYSLKSIGEFICIIDDGFHEFSANIDTFLELKDSIQPGGMYFVEDVHESHLEVWNIFFNLHRLEGRIIDLRKFRPGVKDNILIEILF
jgi:hypothetical protein